MARVTDYVGAVFGNFEISGIVAHGTEAEVLACVNKSTSLAFILRLPADDRELWRGDIVVPPYNYSIERPNARGAWHYAITAHGINVSSLKKDPKAWKINTPAVYGVLNQRYLVPVASPIWRTGAITIDDLLRIMPATAVDGYGPLEVILLHMATSASVVSTSAQDRAEWESAWSYLTGGDIAIGTARRYLRSGTQPQSEKDGAVDMVAKRNHELPEVAENILLRLLSCVARGLLSIDDAWSTLHCRHFRVNVSTHEIQQIITLHQLMSSERFPDKDTVAGLRFLLTALKDQPDNQFERPELFTILANQPDTSVYDLFLQEYVALHQPVATVVSS